MWRVVSDSHRRFLNIICNIKFDSSDLLGVIFGLLITAISLKEFKNRYPIKN
jgi:hypothetical protein